MLAGADLLIFLGFLGAVMAIGFIAGRKEESSEDFFLAGRSIPWWGVAGSVFGTNVSANHLVGMLGVGFSIGFAQSHFELGAVVALLVLAYLFLPVYDRLKIFTLSEYLDRRYNQTASLLYSVILILLIFVQLTAAFYIGSRSLNFILRETGFAPGYPGGVALLVLITATYTIFGGLKAVVYTDVLQSFLLLVAGILVAILTFSQAEVGGFLSMLARDAALPVADQKMRMYLDSDHPDLPWTGALSGLMFMHVFFWSTNQYLVQRTMAARSLTHARFGILTGGYLKLLVPFFSVAGGVAAAQLFAARLPGVAVAPDEAFPLLVKMVVPAGYGLVGIIAAGLIGAIISTIDSMMNSAATLITIDIYRKHVNPAGDGRREIFIGRLTIAAIVSVSAGLAITSYDPNSTGNFFLTVSSRTAYFTPGLVGVFFLGMFWRRATGRGAVAAILAAPCFAFGCEWIYDAWLAEFESLRSLLGAKLNFMHRTFFAVCASMLVQVGVSLGTAREGERTALLWSPSGDFSALRPVLFKIALFLASVPALVGLHTLGLSPALTAALGGGFTTGLFLWHVLGHPREARSPAALLRDDRLFAGVLCGLTMALMLLFLENPIAA